MSPMGQEQISQVTEPLQSLIKPRYAWPDDKLLVSSVSLPWVSVWEVLFHCVNYSNLLLADQCVLFMYHN